MNGALKFQKGPLISSSLVNNKKKHFAFFVLQIPALLLLRQTAGLARDYCENNSLVFPSGFSQETTFERSPFEKEFSFFLRNCKVTITTIILKITVAVLARRRVIDLQAYSKKQFPSNTLSNVQKMSFTNGRK